MWKSLGWIILLVLFCGQAAAQSLIKGKVVDAADKQPLIGATILLENGAGTISDADGLFSLETKATHFEVRYIGYVHQSVEVTDRDSLILVELLPLTNALPAVLISCECSGPSFKTPTHITELSKKDLQVNSGTIITPALNRVPGVFMHSGALNTNRITIRGIGNRSPFATAKIKAYLDHIPLTNGSGETAIEDIDLSLVQKASVFKGPASSIYGAGLGGMIHLETGDPAAPQSRLSTQNSLGSYGLIRNTLLFDHSKDGKNQLKIGVNNTLSEGYRDNNRYGRQGFVAIGKFRFSENEKITVIGNYVNLFARIPSSLDSTDFADHPSKAAFTWGQAKGYESTKKILAGGSYTSLLGKHFSQSSSVYATFRDTYENRPFNILREKSSVRGARTEWIYKNDFPQKARQIEVRIGTELFREDYDWQTNDTNGLGAVGNLLTDNHEKRFYINAFSRIKLDFSNRLAITGGLNLNYTDYQVFDFQNPMNYYREFPLTWSPSLAIGYKLSDIYSRNNDLSLHFKASHGFSPPTLEEALNPDGALNPDILPEQGWNFEVGSRGRFFNTLRYTLSVYSMYIEDLLVARRTALDQYIGINAGETVHKGLELELSYNFQMETTAIRPYLNYAFADYRFETFVDDENDYSGNELTGTAPHQLNAGFSWDQGYTGFYGNLHYQFMDAMPMRDDNSIYSEAYHLVNLKLGYRFSLGKRWQLDCFTGINNVWEEKYASMILINASGFGGNAPRYYYPGLPRNYYGGVKLSVDLKQSRTKFPHGKL